MTSHQTGTRQDWLAAHATLLEREKGTHAHGR